MDGKISSDEVYDDLLRRIVRLELKPGRRISENEMCKHYDVSRSVIRTAFTRLAQNNLLTIYPQRGTYVNLINLNYIKQVLIIRAALEKEVLSRFMKSGNIQDTIEQLEKNLSLQEEYYNVEDYVEAYKHLDAEFHNILLSSIGNGGILNLLNSHLLHLARWRNVYVRSGHKVSNLIDEHRDILEAIKSGDKQKAIEAMSAHIYTVHDLMVVDKTYADYFE